MANTKRSTYADYVDELVVDGIRCLPSAWSAYERPHPDASRVVLTLARGAARHWGEASLRGMVLCGACKIVAANKFPVYWPASPRVAA